MSKFLMWKLHDLSCLDADGIFGDEFDLYGEDQQGRDCATSVSITKTAGEAHEYIEQLERERDKAVKSLKASGFTDMGGEFWRPPIGKNPLFIGVDYSNDYIAKMQAKAAKHAFWRAFELSKSFPDRYDIPTFWNEYRDNTLRSQGGE